MILALLPASLLGACATVPPTSAEIESCQKMKSQMGIGRVHDHHEMRRGQGLNPMDLSHTRCHQTLK